MSKQDNPNVVGNIAIVFMSILLIAVGCIMLFTDAGQDDLFLLRCRCLSFGMGHLDDQPLLFT